MNGFRWAWQLAVVIALVGSISRADDSSTTVRVMSFNVRYGTANDGPNHWDLRKEFLLDTIKNFNPDLLGTQETLGFQRDFLALRLPEYESLGVGRDDGSASGEMMALFYKRERFECLGSGHFWLSEMPEVIGSRSWDSSLPRMVTWVKLRDRRATEAPPIAFFNTHFDHRGPTARLESARLLRRKIQELGEASAVIVTGDFNTGEGTEPYQAFFAMAPDQPTPLVDTFRVKHPMRKSGEGTFGGFMPMVRGGARIDWIGASADWKVLDAAIDHSSRDGRAPSDHFPVTAVLGR